MWKKPGMFLGLMLWVLSGGLVAAEGSRYFLYLSDQRVVTVELLDPAMAILNFINLGDSFEAVRAYELVLVDAEGRTGRGHLIVREDPPSPREVYQVSGLIKPHSFLGYNIAGRYHFATPPDRCYLKVGGRILELEPLTGEQFDQLASMVTELDLKAANSAAMVRDIGFTRGYGVLHKASDIDARLRGYFPDSEVIPTVLAEGSEPKLPSAAAHLKDPVVVVVSVMISPWGGVYDLEVVEGVDEMLDQMALDVVRNSWRFLPAISKGEIVTSELTLNVRFRR